MAKILVTGYEKDKSIQYLTSAGYEVETLAHNQADAYSPTMSMLEQVARLTNEYDAIVISHNNIAGLAIADIVPKLYRSKAIVVTSGDLNPEHKLTYIQKGITHFAQRDQIAKSLDELLKN